MGEPRAALRGRSISPTSHPLVRPTRCAMSRSRSTEPPRDLRAQVRVALGALEASSTKRDRDNLRRFGITAKKAFGVSIANIQVLAKRLGRSHELAGALWKTGWYEARLLTSFVDEPSRVT